jgi:hypothetical protein
MFDEVNILELVDEKNRVDVSEGVPNGLVHVDEPRLGPTFKRLGIPFAKAIVGKKVFRKRGRLQTGSICSGIVIRAIDEQNIRSALDERLAKKKARTARLSVLSAIFTLNRRAKRCRDLAQLYYQANMHGLAGKYKREKERIYVLKGQVLAHLLVEERLKVTGVHQFQGGNFAEVLEGEGYRFHRPCPQPAAPETVILLESIESKPKESSEPTIETAFEAVQRFLSGKERTSVYEWTPRTYRPSRYDHYKSDEDKYTDADFEGFVDDYRERQSNSYDE